jgi:DNA-binding HxlR family transcriptional regulator
MQRTRLDKTQCPVARSLDRVGEWWSILILRDAMQGLTRFDEFQKSLGIAPNILSRRLNKLVESGLLERRKYSDHPERFEYVLTERGEDFRAVLWSLIAWGNRHFAPEGPSLVLVDTSTGLWADPVLVDSKSGKPMLAPEFRPVAGPASGPAIRSRQGFVSRRSGVRLEPAAPEKKAGRSRE